MSNWHGGKGSKRRNSNEEAYADNWEKIFGTQSKEERLREPERLEYRESDFSVESQATYFQEGGMQYAEYSIQYHPPSEDN